MKKLFLICLLLSVFIGNAGATAGQTPLRNGRLLGTFQVQATHVISALDVDWSIAQTFSKTLAANSTFTFSNVTDGRTIVVAITNTASNYTVTWPTVKWVGGTQPVQTVGAKVDVWTFVKIGSVIYGSAIQNVTP